ncbi:MAG: cytochrome c3 family protein, partial [Rhodocyclaceae bacterium]|nr:cytochrome c3 family protein [Rhodocyclaceae bacterium]MDZ4215536.1 cytochrome c3 family protein [Rhodocyclaceae bacterium]
MHTPILAIRPKRWMLFAALFLILAALTVGTPVHAAPAAKLDKASCLKCHDAKQDKISVPVIIDGEEEERDLRQLDMRKFAKSVHSKLQCVDCHQNIVDSQKNHQLDQTAPKTSCAGCHQALWDKAQKDGTAKDKPRLEVVAKNIEAYKH